MSRGRSMRRQIKKLVKKKEIIEYPIKLTIYSSTCNNLTLIDLPGITKLAIED